MSVKLINGDGNSAVYANQDADWFAGMAGEKTRILPINERMGYTLVSNNAINIKSGVCVTKEGRRIQIDVGDLEQIAIPTGAQNVRRWYIIGFRLYTTQDGDQLAETFIEQVESASSTITEEMFKEGATEIYVSLYRIYQNGISIDEVVPLLDNLNNNINPIVDMAWPVGSLYPTTNPINPSNYFGGTWVIWGQGRVAIGVDPNQTEFDTVEETGGSKTVKPTINSATITTSNMATMNADSKSTISDNFTTIVNAFQSLRDLWNYNKNAGKVTGNVDIPNPSTTYPTTSLAKAYNASHSHTANDVSILPPYITMYWWKRTA